MEPLTTLFECMQPPYLLQVKRTNWRKGTSEWVLVQSVNSMEEGLRVASHMCTSYDYRLYLGKQWGVVYLEWVDDPSDKDMCIPKWSEVKDN